MTAPLVAFVGPTISAADAASICPGLDVRPPVRRNDLYREREKGAWGFLIIDGVFMQHDAVSPREVADVLDDGALVVGASSMGALRAADCWPVGARGIGLIYRLYRRGVLGSDEDVAVAVSGDGSHSAVSLPLVNVRYALSRAVRRRLLDRAAAQEILGVAASIYYPERTWPLILRGTTALSPAVVEFCARVDLKREDAVQALSHVAGLLADPGPLVSRHARRGAEAFARSEVTRERAYDAMGGVDPDRLRPALLDWLIGTGRLARYVAVSSWPEPDAAVSFAGSTWRDLDAANQLDAELMRLQAVERAETAAADAGLDPTPDDVRRAREEIARHHGARSWDRLLASPVGRLHADSIGRAERRLAIAKRMRRAWFRLDSARHERDASVRRSGGRWSALETLFRRHRARV